MTPGVVSTGNHDSKMPRPRPEWPPLPPPPAKPSPPPPLVATLVDYTHASAAAKADASIKYKRDMDRKSEAGRKPKAGGKYESGRKSTSGRSVACKPPETAVEVIEIVCSPTAADDESDVTVLADYVPVTPPRGPGVHAQGGQSLLSAILARPPPREYSPTSVVTSVEAGPEQLDEPQQPPQQQQQERQHRQQAQLQHSIGIEMQRQRSITQPTLPTPPAAACDDEIIIPVRHFPRQQPRPQPQHPDSMQPSQRLHWARWKPAAPKVPPRKFQKKAHTDTDPQLASQQTDTASQWVSKQVVRRHQHEHVEKARPPIKRRSSSSTQIPELATKRIRLRLRRRQYSPPPLPRQRYSPPPLPRWPKESDSWSRSRPARSETAASSSSRRPELDGRRRGSRKDESYR